MSRLFVTRDTTSRLTFWRGWRRWWIRASCSKSSKKMVRSALLMLETIREYGLDRLAASGEKEVTHRSARRLLHRAGRRDNPSLTTAESDTHSSHSSHK